jgi:putative membrane protein
VIPGIAAFIFIAFTAGGIAINTWLLTGGVTAVLIVPIAVAAFSYVAWRRLTFWFDEDGDFRVNSGIIMRRERRVQLSRLQAVDIAQPFVARLLGFSALSIEVAGMQDSRVKLAFFRKDQATNLRAEIVARAAGMRPDVGEAPAVVISHVPTSRLIGSLLLRTTTVLLVALTTAILVTTVISRGWGGLVLALTTGSLPIILVVVEFMLNYRFTIAQSPDGLRLTSGLLQTQTRTVPPGRIQAIDVVQPWLWRRVGWARIRINIAGVGTQESNSQKRETLLTPVAPLWEIQDLLQRVLPGFSLDDLAWQHVPPRTRWRSPIQWRQLAFARTQQTLCVRRGRITSHRIIIGDSRTQSVRLTQGPWERMLGMATVHVDTTPGPVKVAVLHQPIDEAQQIMRTQLERARTSRTYDRSTRWMQHE